MRLTCYVALVSDDGLPRCLAATLVGFGLRPCGSSPWDLHRRERLPYWEPCVFWWAMTDSRVALRQRSWASGWRPQPAAGHWPAATLRFESLGTPAYKKGSHDREPCVFWWAMTDSNRRPYPCKGSALPTAPIARRCRFYHSCVACGYKLMKERCFAYTWQHEYLH